MRYTIDMTTTYTLLKSRTFWTIVIMSLLPVVTTYIVPTLPPEWATVANIVLGAIAIAFHNDTAQKAGATN